jgi:hypothetical protein
MFTFLYSLLSPSFSFIHCFTAFKDAPLVQTGGEQNLEFYALFQKYLEVFERELSEFIETNGYSVDEFYKQINDVKEGGL